MVKTAHTPIGLDVPGIKPEAPLAGIIGATADGRPGIGDPDNPGKTATAPGRAEPLVLLDSGIISGGSTGGTGFFSRAR